jgi:hypothetical protein
MVPAFKGLSWRFKKRLLFLGCVGTCIPGRRLRQLVLAWCVLEMFRAEKISFFFLYTCMQQLVWRLTSGIVSGAGLGGGHQTTAPHPAARGLRRPLQQPPLLPHLDTHPCSLPVSSGCFALIYTPLLGVQSGDTLVSSENQITLYRVTHCHFQGPLSRGKMCRDCVTSGILFFFLFPIIIQLCIVRAPIGDALFVLKRYQSDATLLRLPKTFADTF